MKEWWSGKAMEFIYLLHFMEEINWKFEAAINDDHWSCLIEISFKFWKIVANVDWDSISVWVE